MNFVVIGTDHRMQHSEAGLKGLLQAWMAARFIEPLSAIAEEFHDDIGDTSVAQELARDRKLTWFNIDMTTEEKRASNILDEQRRRPAPQGNTSYRVPSDDTRENVWVEKLVNTTSGTVIVVCGYSHLEPLVEKLRAGGHAVDKRVYLDTVPSIELAQAGGQAR
jgi:hypothetical protein